MLYLSFTSATIDSFIPTLEYWGKRRNNSPTALIAIDP